MEETTVLILLAVVMLIGSYLAGSIPLVVNLSEEKLQLVSVLGAGMLVGTALAVIIPEGVRSLVSKPHEILPPEKKDSISAVVPVSYAGTDVHGIIGMSLVLGFLFMLLIDQISSSRNKVADIENAIKGTSHGATATIGLVVHSAADGVALGAAASTAHHDIEIIIFLAIMLHKAPAAFGLVTFLLHEGLERVRIRKHLLVFSLAAPLMALLTYFGLGQSLMMPAVEMAGKKSEKNSHGSTRRLVSQILVEEEGKETLSSVNATGAAMLFSAGTFLYVATVHVLPELILRRSNHSIGANSHTGHTLGKSELFAMVVGALLPSLLTMGHHH